MYEHGRVGRIELGRIFSGSGDKKKVDKICLLENGRNIRYIENTVAIIKKDSVTFVDPLSGNYDSDRGLEGVRIDSRRNVSHFWADSPCLDKEIQHAAYLAFQEKSRRENKAGSEKTQYYLKSH